MKALNEYQAIRTTLQGLSHEEMQSLLIPLLLDKITARDALELLVQQHWKATYQDCPEKELSPAFEAVLHFAEITYGFFLNTATGGVYE